MIRLFSNFNLLKGNVANKLILCQRHKRLLKTEPPKSTQSILETKIKLESFANNQQQNNLGHFDIVINGGGIVGLTFLLNLQRNLILSEKRILLIEQQNFIKPNSAIQHFDNKRELSNRVSSLTDASKQCFEQIGIWSEINKHAKKIKEMQIWSTSIDKAISFDTTDLMHKEMNINYIVENFLILDALNRHINHDQILYSTNVIDIQEIDNQINIFTKSKIDSTFSKLTCTLLVGCDGFNSLVRNKSNLKYFNLPLDQTGVVGTIKMDFSNQKNFDNSISFQRFLPNQTVVAILPLTNKESSFVISTNKEFAKQLVEMSEDEFVSHFNRLIDCETKISPYGLLENIEKFIEKNLPISMIKPTKHRILPKISSLQTKSRASFPLGFGTTLPNLVGGIGNSSNINLALIGDSAHRVHPLAGQGLNLGIGDSMVLSKCLIASMERGEELFVIDANDRCPLKTERLENALNNFEKERQLKLIAMMSAIHYMQDLFHFTPPILLNVFDHMNWIKSKIVRFANSI